MPQDFLRKNCGEAALPPAGNRANRHDDDQFQILIHELEAVAGECQLQEDFLERTAEVLRTRMCASNWRVFLESAIDKIMSDDVPRGTSHAHENGFIKIGLFKSLKSGMQVRLHIWSSENSIELSAIHDHRWPFVSVILIGGLQLTNYRVAGESDAAATGMLVESQVISDAVAGVKKYTMRTGSAVLKVDSRCDALAGSIHALSDTVPHRTVPVRECSPTASLVVTARATKPYSTRYVPETARFGVGLSGNRALFGREECVESITKFLMRCGRSEVGSAER